LVRKSLFESADGSLQIVAPHGHHPRHDGICRVQRIMVSSAIFLGLDSEF
jgi:hypothetical protein